MEQHDAAGLHIFENPVGYIACRYALPVEAVYIPLYGAHAHGVYRADDSVVILAVGTAEQRRLRAGYFFYLLVRGRDV